MRRKEDGRFFTAGVFCNKDFRYFDIQLFHESGIARTDPAFFCHGSNTQTGKRLEIGCRIGNDLPPECQITDRFPIGMFREVFQTCRQCKQFLFCTKTVQGNNVTHHRLSERQRSGFVKDNHMGIVQILQCAGVFEKDPQFSRPSGANHDRNRRCQTQSAGAADDQHGDHRLDRMCQIPGKEQPQNKGKKGDPDHRRHKNPADPVCQAGDGRLAVRCFFHQFNDFGKGGFRADLFCLELQKSNRTDRTGKDLHPHDLANGNAFSGQGGLIQCGRTGEHCPIYGNGVAATDNYHISGFDQRERHFMFLAVFINECRFRTQFHQFGDRITRMSTADHFQIFPQRHDHQDHPRCFKVQFPHHFRMGRKHQISNDTDAVKESRCRADRHQRFHIRDPLEQVLKAPDIIVPVQEEDRQQQQQLDHGGSKETFRQRCGERQPQESRQRKIGKTQQKDQRDEKLFAESFPFRSVLFCRICHSCLLKRLNGKTNICNRLHDLFRSDCLRIIGGEQRFFQQTDLHRFDAVQFPDCRFHMALTGRTRHAVHKKLLCFDHTFTLSSDEAINHHRRHHHHRLRQPYLRQHPSMLRFLLHW